jgi:hypothetical protein
MIERRSPRTLLLIAALGVAACGSGEDSASDVAAGEAPLVDDVSEEVGGTASAADVLGDGDAPDESGVRGDGAGIMLASVLDPGVIEVEVDGEIYEFRRDDPEQADFECSVSEERVQLAFQSGTNDHAMLLEFSDASLIGGPEGRFTGRATIEPRTLESGFYAAEQSEIDAEFIDRESPYAFVVLDGVYAESRSDLEYDSVGTMIVRANCETSGDAGASTGDPADADEGAAPLLSGAVGTADADGHAATFELFGEPVSYDFGAVVDDVRCSSAVGVARADGSIEVPSGTVGFEAVLYNPSDVGEQLDLPYIWVQDDDAGVGYVAGAVPGHGSIDSGGSAVYQVTITDDGFEATGGFIEIGGDPLALIPGTLTVSCP